MLEQGTISIHTDNIFPLSRSHSTRPRNLLAGTSIKRRKFKAQNGISRWESIQVTTLANQKFSHYGQKKTPSITDNGIGMSAEEVKKYIQGCLL